MYTDDLPRLPAGNQMLPSIDLIELSLSLDLAIRAEYALISVRDLILATSKSERRYLLAAYQTPHCRL